MKILSSATRHNIKWNTMVGELARKFTCWLGLKLLNKGRSLLRWSLGRCSWCGCNPGLASSVSNKGLRCSSLNKNCDKMP